MVLAHKCEGRLFLTDRNGFYNDLLQSAYQKMSKISELTLEDSHVMILLTSN